MPATGEPIGVDLGIKVLAVCSDGRPLITNPKALRTHLKKLRRACRRLSRRTKGSKNREKARKLLARLHARIANIRRNALHQVTSALTHAPLSPAERVALRVHFMSTLPEPTTKAEVETQSKQVKRLLHQTTEANAPQRPRIIVLEDLNVAGMMKNHTLSRAMSDVGMGKFRHQMTYKTMWNGESVLLADRFYPSTKRCSACGHVKAIMALSERVYVCAQEGCQLIVDRDLNAARNPCQLT